MEPIGYIVQYSDEEDYTIYHGFMRLYRNFSEALDHAKALYQTYLEKHCSEEVGIFEVYSPTKRQCDTQGSVKVFECRDRIVWIDCVVE